MISIHRFWTTIFCAVCLGTIFVFNQDVQGFGPVDDHHFISTLFQGKSFGFYVMPELGRFIPLTAQEYVLAARLMEPSPSMFHFISGMKAVVCGVLLLVCLLATGLPSLSATVLWCACIFSIGFANAIIRLQIGELNVLILTMLFIATTLKASGAAYREPEKSKTKASRFWTLVGVFALITAFFYKEITFVFALTFATAEMTRRWRQGLIRSTLALNLLLVFGTAYIIFYSTWYLANVNNGYSNFHSNTTATVLAQYADNDSLIVYFLLPLAVLRSIYVLVKPARQTVYDAFLMAAAAYVCAFLALRIYNTYYLLPTYGFFVCGLAGLLVDCPSRLRRIAAVLPVFVLSVNNLPLALADAQALKVISNNHYQFARFLSDYLRQSSERSEVPRRMELKAVNPGNGIEIISSLKAFLSFFGTPPTSYELITTEPTNNTAISDFYNVQSRTDYRTEIGDLVIFNPYQTISMPTPAETPSFKSIYKSTNEWVVPRWTLTTWFTCALIDVNCSMKVLSERRYTGYGIIVATRKPLPLLVGPVQAPAYVLGPLRLPATWAAGASLNVNVPIVNAGKSSWPANGTAASAGLVHLASVWLTADGKIAREGGRGTFYETIGPADEARVELTLTAPASPGRYRLIISPVQEGVQWFYKAIDEVQRIDTIVLSR